MRIEDRSAKLSTVFQTVLSSFSLLVFGKDQDMKVDNIKGSTQGSISILKMAFPGEAKISNIHFQ